MFNENVFEEELYEFVTNKVNACFDGISVDNYKELVESAMKINLRMNDVFRETLHQMFVGLLLNYRAPSKKVSFFTKK